MAKTPSHITPLPVELLSAKSSTQLISEYVERLSSVHGPICVAGQDHTARC